MCTNSTYKLLPNDEIREKIFNGTLDENDYDNEDTRNFKSAIRKGTNRRNKLNLLIEGEWVHAVMKSKKCSTSSVFSNRNCAVCECTLGS